MSRLSLVLVAHSTIAICGLATISQAAGPVITPLVPLQPAITIRGTATATAAPVAAPAAAGAAKPAASVPAVAPLPSKSLPNPTINANVTEWVVFVADAVNPEFNARNLFRDSLPPFMEDLRTAPLPDQEKPGEPGPVGVIRLTAAGPIEKDASVDIQLGYKNGRALGHWPRAKVRASGILWQDLLLSADKTEPRTLPEGSWLASLRTSGIPLQSAATRESFLLYDVELAYPLLMQVTGGKGGKYSVAHGMEAPLRDLTFYKRTADGHWQTGALANLAKAAGYVATPAPAAAPDAQPEGKVIRRMNANGVVYTTTTINGAVTTTITRNGAPVASEQPAAAPPPAPSSNVKPTEVALGAPAATDATILDSWRVKLSEAGLSAADQEIVLKILARKALDPKRLTAIYRMDPAELDRILPLEVVPQPKKVSRIALVVVTGIDPAIGDELDHLIVQLGDPVWKTREAAMAEIKKLGIRAKSRLEEAVKNSDTEIAYRAEQLLGDLSSDAGQQPDADAAAPAQATGGIF